MKRRGFLLATATTVACGSALAFTSSCDSIPAADKAPPDSDSESSAERVDWPLRIDANAHRSTPLVLDDDLVIPTGLAIVRLAMSENRRMWEYPLAADVPAQLLATSERILVSATYATSEPHSGALIGLDSRSGSERWRVESAALSLDPLLLKADRFVSADATGNIRVVQISGGQVVWERDFAIQIDALAASDDLRTIYVSTFNWQLIAIRARDGRELWRRNFASPPSILGLLAKRITIDLEVRSDQDAGLAILDAKNGRTIWGIRHPELKESFQEKGILVTHVGASIYALSLPSRDAVWQYPSTNMVEHRGLHAKSRLIVAEPSKIIAIDIESGQPEWTFELEPSMGIIDQMVSLDLNESHCLLRLQDTDDFICLDLETGALASRATVAGVGPVVGVERYFFFESGHQLHAMRNGTLL